MLAVNHLPIFDDHQHGNALTARVTRVANPEANVQSPGTCLDVSASKAQSSIIFSTRNHLTRT